MLGWTDRRRARVAAVAAAGSALASVCGGASYAAPSSSGEPAEATVVLSFADDRITESSGLVDRGSQLLTVNDSGDGPFVYVVERRTGRTAGTVTYSTDEVADVEAMAPAGRHAVWVGDIGDNARGRAFVEVYRVRIPSPTTGDRTVRGRPFRLVYPDAPHDAEALLRHPRTGRLYLVTKWITGGTVYAAPRRLRPGTVHRLTPVGQVPGLVTGGEFLPGGDHLVLRTYSTARVFTFPALEPVAELTLPEQEQGEALAVSDRGTVLVSTEGKHSEVLAVALPPGAVPTRPPSAGSPDRGTPNASPAGRPAGADDDGAAGAGSATAGDPPWVAGGLAGLVLLGLLLVRRRRAGQSRSTT